MSGEAKSGGASGGAGGFRSRMEYYLYSGDKKHVAAGIVIFGIIFGIPWALMNRGFCSFLYQFLFFLLLSPMIVCCF